jgi:hypothetical protein
MSITTIGNINQVCETSVNPQRAEEKIYFDGQPRLGMVLYTDKGKNTRKTAGIYGLKFQGKTYKIQTDNQGIVTVFDGQCSAAVLPKRFIAYQHVNTWDINKNIEVMKQQTDEMVAAGANCLHLSIIFDYAFRSNAELVANANSSWANYDNFFQHAASKNLPVGLRICLAMDDNYVSQFWGYEHGSKDPWGYDYKPFYGNNIPCLSSPVGRNMMIDFYTKVLDRYIPVFGDNLFFIQPTTTSTQEFGGEWRNWQFPQPQYNSFGDYNQYNINGFRTWLTAKYSNINNLKTAWGSVSLGYSGFGDVLPPYPFNTNRFETTWDGLRGMLSGQRGKDWYQFHHENFRNLFVELSNIAKARKPDVEMSVLFGTCSDEISLSGYAYNVVDWCRVADHIQTLYSTRNFADQFDDISVDYISSLATKPIHTEVADFDAFNANAALTYSRYAMNSGAKFMAIVSDKANIDRWNDFKALVTTLVNEYANAPISLPTYEGSINVSLNETIQSWTSVKSRWLAAGGSRTKHIQINFNENA